MLDGLDDIAWDELGHAYGAATDVPMSLRMLASPESVEREQALHDLFGNIWHQGTVYQATASTVPFLVELAQAPAVAGRAEILGLIGAIAESDDGPRDAHDAVVRHALAIAGLFDDREPGVRAGVAYVLGWLRELRKSVEPLLRSRLERDENAVARASALIALAALGDLSALTAASIERHFAACTDKEERFAAAFSLALCSREATPGPALEVLAHACTNPLATSRWFQEIPADLAPETMPRRALVAAGRTSYVALPILLDALGASRDADDASCVVEDALAIVFGVPDDVDDEENAFDDLNEAQRRVLRAIVDAPILWRHSDARWLADYGVMMNRAELAALAQTGKR